MSENMYFDDDAPLDQDLKSERIPDPQRCMQTKTLDANDQCFGSALDAAKAGFVVGYSFDSDDLTRAYAKAGVDPSSTDRTKQVNKNESVRGVIAEECVIDMLLSAGFDCGDTEHFEKENGDIELVQSDTTLEIKSRTMYEAYEAGHDAFPIRHSGFSADIGVICLVSVEKQKCVIAGWEHGRELAAFTRAYSDSETFTKGDKTEDHDAWVYPFDRMHSINTLHYILKSRR
jgi:hypothetical protein